MAKKNFIRERITLRELINQLESLSNGGKNDKMPVIITDDWTTHSDTVIRRVGSVKPYHDDLMNKDYIAIDVSL